MQNNSTMNVTTFRNGIRVVCELPPSHFTEQQKRAFMYAKVDKAQYLGIIK